MITVRARGEKKEYTIEFRSRETHSPEQNRRAHTRENNNNEANTIRQLFDSSTEIHLERNQTTPKSNTCPHAGYHLFRNLTPIKLLHFHLHRSFQLLPSPCFHIKCAHYSYRISIKLI